MDIKTTRADFNGSIILGQGYCSNIWSFFKYDLNIKSDNYYNSGCYGWNYSIKCLNNTLKDLNYNVYIVNSYRNEPTRNKTINYKLIDAYFDKIIKNYKKKVEKINWREKEKINKQYIKRITKKLNEIIYNCYIKEQGKWEQ